MRGRREMKPAMMDLSKWAGKTAQAVERICGSKEAPCVGFSLVFFDPLAPEEERWNYVIELAYDPHNPPEEEERVRVRKAFEYISQGVQKIMGGDFEDDPEDYTIRGDLH